MSTPCYYCDLERGIDCKLCIHKVDVAELIQQAHRAGWEQAKREAQVAVECADYDADDWSRRNPEHVAVAAITNMSYKEPTNGN